MTKELREVILDIETTGFKADWGKLLCVVLKPIGGDPIILRLDEMEGFRRRPWDDSQLLVEALDVLRRTAKVITWYGSRFDIPFLRGRRLMINANIGINIEKGGGEVPIFAISSPIPPVTALMHLDAWKLRRNYAFSGGTLEIYAQNLVHREKPDVRPLAWQLAAHGLRGAMDEVVARCLADVEILEQVYLEMEKSGVNTSRVSFEPI